jgi:heme/copper-type cytochrome/quinol oxidase subunit 2
VTALIITLVLMGTAQILAQTTSPTETDDDGPRGAASDRGAFNPIWIVLVSAGFVTFVLVGLLWRNRQRPGEP